MLTSHDTNKIIIQPSDNKSRVINIEKDAQVVEFVSEVKFENQNTKIKIAANAKVDYIFLLDKKVKKNFYENRIIEVDDNVTLNSWYCYFGGNENKINLNYKIKANAEVKHRTIFLAEKNQRFNFNNNYEFLSPGSTGEFTIYGILKNSAQSNSLANIKINKQANKIKAHIDMKLYLSGDNSQGTMLPGLDINNDDVEAGHRASVSHILEDDLFYMKSRGLSKNMAEKLMIDGTFSSFSQELFDENIAKKLKI